MKESAKDRRNEVATKEESTVNPKEIRETFRNFSATNLLAISEVLTGMAKKKIKGA